MATKTRGPTGRGYARRHEAAAFLGYASKTLANWASSGFGPPYIKPGKYALYPWGPLEDWAAEQTR